MREEEEKGLTKRSIINNFKMDLDIDIEGTDIEGMDIIMEGGGGGSKVDAAQRQSQTFRNLAQNGPALMYIVLIQALATQTFIMLALKQVNKSKQTSSKGNQRAAKMMQSDMTFLMWYVIFTGTYSALLGYAMWRRWLPPAPPRCFFGMFTAIPGVYLSIFVEYICRVGDKRGTRMSIKSIEGFTRRVWMHTLVGMVVSVAILFLLP